MLLPLILASGLFLRQPTYPSWIVTDPGNCVFKDSAGKPIPITNNGQPYPLDGNFTVSYNYDQGCSNPTIQAVLAVNIYTQVVLDMGKVASNGGNYQMNLVTGDPNYTEEVAFSPDEALGGNVSIYDGDTFVPDKHFQHVFGLEPGTKFKGLSRFRVRRLSGQHSTTLAGNGTIYHVCQDNLTPDKKAFDLYVASGSVYVVYEDTEFNFYNDTVITPNIERIMTDDQPLTTLQWETPLGKYPAPLLTNQLSINRLRGGRPGHPPRPRPGSRRQHR